MLSRQTTDYRYNGAEMLNDPDRVFDRIRQDGDVVWSATMRRWIVVSKAAAEQALRNRALITDDLFGNFEKVSARASVDLDDLVAICKWIPFLYDGPRHVSLRQLFARLLADIKTDYLVAFGHASRDLLAGLCRRGSGDLVRDYTDCVHAFTMGTLLGLDARDQKWLAQNTGSQGSIDFAASVPEMLLANGRATEIFSLIDLTAVSATGGAFLDRVGRALTAASLEDTPAHRRDCLAALVLLGRDTLSGTLSVGMSYLLDSHDGVLTNSTWPDLKQLVDEFVRLSSAVQITVRVAEQELQIGTQTIKAGDTVMILLPAANHDPVAFKCPHTVDFGQIEHIAYGAGRHLCIGMPLANMSIAIALSDLSKLARLEAVPGRLIGSGRNTRKFDTFPVTARQ